MPRKNRNESAAIGHQLKKLSQEEKERYREINGITLQPLPAPHPDDKEEAYWELTQSAELLAILKKLQEIDPAPDARAFLIPAENFPAVTDQYKFLRELSARDLTTAIPIDASGKDFRTVFRAPTKQNKPFSAQGRFITIFVGAGGAAWKPLRLGIINYPEKTFQQFSISGNAFNQQESLYAINRSMILQPGDEVIVSINGEEQLAIFQDWYKEDSHGYYESGQDRHYNSPIVEMNGEKRKLNVPKDSISLRDSQEEERRIQEKLGHFPSLIEHLPETEPPQ